MYRISVAHNNLFVSNVFTVLNETSMPSFVLFFLRGLATCALLGLCLSGCAPELRQAGKRYQSTQQAADLQTVVDLLPSGADSSRLRRLLGVPIDMGFDWRYLVDSSGPQGCVVGAVFHFDEQGKVDQQWVGEICE